MAAGFQAEAFSPGSLSEDARKSGAQVEFELADPIPKG
jgi:hypothetical protein